MLVTDFGIVIEVRPVHPRNTPVPILVIFSEIFTEVRLSQSSKAQSSIV